MKYLIFKLYLLAFLVIQTGMVNGQVSEDQEGSARVIRHPGEYSRHSAFIEFAGPGVLYSVNYEYRIAEKIGLRAGVSWWSVDSLDLASVQLKNLKFNSFPVMLTFVPGNKAAHLELGLGLMPVTASGDFDVFYFIKAGESGSNTKVLGISTLSFRYQRKGNGIILRAGINPVFTLSDFYPAFGLSFGYAF